MIIDIFDGENSCEEAISIIDENIVYHKGELVKDEEFDGSLFHEGKGIHFFITRAEAEKTVFDFFIREDEPDEEVEVDNENGN